jgi:hypothetical protein
MLQSDKAPLAVADYYAAELTGKGFKVQRTNTSATSQSIATVAATKDKISASVTAINDGEQAKTQVSLGWEAR